MILKKKDKNITRTNSTPTYLMLEVGAFFVIQGKINK
jgi:hypothetical protein